MKSVFKDCRVYSADWGVQHLDSITSQSGQDGVIRKIFEIIGTESKYCVEFGAWDGLYLSNTWTLINDSRWCGCLIEYNPETFASLEQRYADRPDVFTLNEAVSWEGESSLDSILQRVNAPLNLDYMSIDIDGNDWHVWNAMVKYKPRVVQIEYNPTIPSAIYFVQAAEWGVSKGASLRAIVELGRSKGYELVSTVPDCYFVQKEDFDKFGFPPVDISRVQLADRLTWETYDGEIYFTGRDKKIWTDAPSLKDEPVKLTYAPDVCEEVDRL